MLTKGLYVKNNCPPMRVNDKVCLAPKAATTAFSSATRSPFPVCVLVTCDAPLSFVLDFVVAEIVW